jgi:D-glycero-alpha-D-manno-heptose 1-phosphate guanylyltransferase
MTPIFKDIDVVILCGGKGTRLQPVISDRPKALAAFGDTTFLDILLASLQESGFIRFILCVGYMKEQIKDRFKNNAKYPPILFSEENEPLGTGGALKNAQSLIQSETFMVLNGDSICNINFSDFYSFHKNRGALLSMALVQNKDTKDFGSVAVNESGEITGFKEKNVSSHPSLINAGIYFMQNEIFAYMPRSAKFSLELDFFPGIAGEQCAGFIINSELIDIGIPERYANAVRLIGGKK